MARITHITLDLTPLPDGQVCLIIWDETNSQPISSAVFEDWSAFLHAFAKFPILPSHVRSGVTVRTLAALEQQATLTMLPTGPLTH